MIRKRTIPQRGKKVCFISREDTRQLNLSNIEFRIVDQRSGACVARILKNNIIRIPRNVVGTDQISTVVSHEYAHIKNKDSYKYQVIELILVCSVVGIMYMIGSNVIFYIISVFSGLLISLILNIYRHKIEFRADDFASECVGCRQVVDRLSRNTHLYKNEYSKYLSLYPNIRERIQRQFNKY